VLRTKVPQPGGGFLEAFELGLVDLNCWGDQYYDMAGYPYADEVHAFVHDWVNLGGDFEVAMRKMNDLTRQRDAKVAGATGHGERSQTGQSTPEAAK
jgi:hypothetical protein